MKTYTLDHVYDKATTNAALFDAELRTRLKDVLAGYNLTVFAYGASGGGKTYLMQVGEGMGCYGRGDGGEEGGEGR